MRGSPLAFPARTRSARVFTQGRGKGALLQHDGTPREMLFTFLLLVQALVAAAMVGFILLQKSEGGGLGMGGSPSGLMSARGAADFLTRGTSILATAFVGLSIVLAFLAASHRTQRVDVSAALPARPTAPLSAPAGRSVLGGGDTNPLTPQKSAAQVAAEAEAKAKGQAPAPSTPGNSSVPIER